MTIPTDLLERQERALARAVLYRLASALFRYPDGDARRDRRAAAEGVPAALARGLAAEEREALLAGLAELDRLDAPERVERDHARLIGHTPRAAATPYETEWRGAAGELLQFHQLADLSGFYRAYGLALDSSCHERPDHLAVELAFLHFLCAKEAYACAEGLPDLAELARAGQRRFLADHLLAWAPGFCLRLERDDPSGFYGRAARLLADWMAAERRLLDVPEAEAAVDLGASRTTLEDCCVACDASAACVAGSARGEGPGGAP